MAVGKVTRHLCLTPIIKELKISVEQDRVVTTLNIIEFSVVLNRIVNESPTKERVMLSEKGDMMGNRSNARRSAGANSLQVYYY